MGDDALRIAKRLRKGGQGAEAMEVLRSALSLGELPPEKLEAAGRFIEKLCASSTGEEFAPSFQLRVFGQCTTAWLTRSLPAVAWSHGVLIRAADAGYDNVLQDLLAAESAGEKPDVVVLVPWSRRLLGDGSERSPEQRLEDELQFWTDAWALVSKLGSRLVMVGYDVMGPGADGYSLSGRAGQVSLIRRLNEALRQHLPSDAYFVDLAQVAGSMGRERFYEPRSWYWTKQPFSWPGLARLAKHVWAGARALLTGPKKVLVLDLDNTVWGGVVGEEGPLGVQLGDTPDGRAYRALQCWAKALSARGVVLAVCSKNNPADAREPFETHPDMVLSLSDFAAFEASWDPKSVALRRIAATLRLGLDSFVFVDDNPAERQQVRMALPEVAVPELPTDPADVVRCLEEGLYFEAVSVSQSDTQRAGQYQAEFKRRRVQSSFVSLKAYLDSLEMVAEVSPIGDPSMPRVAQLLGKTNQFNLTTRRHSASAVRDMLDREGALGLTLALRDRFGDYGLVGVVLGRAEGNGELVLDTWLMSCRVIARSVEEHLLNCVAARARELGHRVLIGEYVPTAKNAVVADMYTRFGFEEIRETDDLPRYRLNLESFGGLKTHVRPAADGPEATPRQ